MNSDNFIGFVVMFIFCGLLLIGISGPYFEARTFNKCTGGNASYFDAVFTELRVMECNK